VSSREGEYIQQLFTHKDWSSSRASTLEINVKTANWGACLLLEQKNIPINKLNTVEPIWDQFCLRTGGVSIQSVAIVKSAILTHTPNEVFSRFFDISVLQSRIFPKCEITKKVGGHWHLGFIMDGDCCRGTIEDINENKLIVISMWFADWPISLVTSVQIQINQLGDNDEENPKTLLTISNNYLPQSRVKDVNNFWEKLLRSLFPQTVK